jgi:hypothetical protein
VRGIISNIERHEAHRLLIRENINMLTLKPFHAEPTTFIPAGATAHFVGHFTKYDMVGDLYITKCMNSQGDEEISAIWASESFPEYFRGTSIAAALEERALGSNLQAAFHRAIEQGLLTKQTYVAGVSRIKDKEIDDAYHASDFWKAWLVIYNNGCYEDDAWDKHCEAYEKAHGEIPKNSRKHDFYVFENEEEAKRYCPEGQGTYQVISAVNEYHLRTIMAVRRLDLTI